VVHPFGRSRAAHSLSLSLVATTARPPPPP